MAISPITTAAAYNTPNFKGGLKASNVQKAVSLGQKAKDLYDKGWDAFIENGII